MTTTNLNLFHSFLGFLCFVFFLHFLPDEINFIMHACCSTSWVNFLNYFCLWIKFGFISLTFIKQKIIKKQNKTLWLRSIFLQKPHTLNIKIQASTMPNYMNWNFYRARDQSVFSKNATSTHADLRRIPHNHMVIGSVCMYI